MKKSLPRLIAVLCFAAALLAFAGVLVHAAGTSSRGDAAALAVAYRYLEQSCPQQRFCHNGSVISLSDRLCRMGFVDAAGHTRFVTVWRGPLGSCRVCGMA